MIRSSTSARRGRASRSATAAAAAVVTALVLTVTVAADSHDRVPPPPANPTSADQIQNIDQVKTAIKAYYGDMVDPTRTNPVDSSVPLHTFSPTGAYANEVDGIASDAAKYLKSNHGHASTTKAVLFDVDDTTLNTYSYEIYTSFVYSPMTNGQFVNAEVYPAVPHMVDLEHHAESRGYTVFFLTGRPESQRAATEGNLVNEGYDVVSADVYLKDYTVDTWLSPCAPTCSTTQYKTLTREHIESLGYEIIANFGDQYSDLNGGFARKTFKMPNPMYYLP